MFSMKPNALSVKLPSVTAPSPPLVRASHCIGTPLGMGVLHITYMHDALDQIYTTPGMPPQSQAILGNPGQSWGGQAV